MSRNEFDNDVIEVCVALIKKAIEKRSSGIGIYEKCLCCGVIVDMYEHKNNCPVAIAQRLIEGKGIIW